MKHVNVAIDQSIKRHLTASRLAFRSFSVMTTNPETSSGISLFRADPGFGRLPLAPLGPDVSTFSATQAVGRRLTHEHNSSSIGSASRIALGRNRADDDRTSTTRKRHRNTP